MGIACILENLVFFSSLRIEFLDAITTQILHESPFHRAEEWTLSHDLENLSTFLGKYFCLFLADLIQNVIRIRPVLRWLCFFFFCALLFKLKQ